MLNVSPKVSVCIVTYNHEQYIAECLSSILTQDVDFPFEVIIGNDCSKDRTAEIIEGFAEAYPGVITVVRYEKNVGPTENYAKVHSLAKGEYVCHCDGDDFWLQGKLAKQVAYMDAHPEVAQTWHRQHVVDAHSQRIGVFPKRFPRALLGRPMRLSDLALSYGLVGQHSSQMYRRSAKTVHRRDRPTIDYFFALDIASQGLSVHLPIFLGCYRIVAGGSVTQSANGRNQVDLCVVDAAKYYSEKFPVTKAAFKANILVRAFGAVMKKRENGRDMMAEVGNFPTSLLAILRSAAIFACHRL